VKRIIVDTGPLVALLNRRDHHHQWSREVLGALEPPLLTCEAVIAEACFLLRHIAGGQDAVLALLAQGIVKVDFRVHSDLEAIRRLVRKFANVPMSLADACLVRMTERDSDSVVLTLDSDFRVYRRNRRHVIPIMMPSSD